MKTGQKPRISLVFLWFSKISCFYKPLCPSITRHYVSLGFGLMAAFDINVLLPYESLYVWLFCIGIIRHLFLCRFLLSFKQIRLPICREFFVALLSHPLCFLCWLWTVCLFVIHTVVYCIVCMNWFDASYVKSNMPKHVQPLRILLLLYYFFRYNDIPDQARTQDFDQGGGARFYWNKNLN